MIYEVCLSSICLATLHSCLAFQKRLRFKSQIVRVPTGIKVRLLTVYLVFTAYLKCFHNNCFSHPTNAHEHSTRVCVALCWHLRDHAHVSSCQQSLSSDDLEGEAVCWLLWFCMPSCSRLNNTTAQPSLRPLATSVSLNPDGAMRCLMFGLPTSSLSR